MYASLYIHTTYKYSSMQYAPLVTIVLAIEIVHNYRTTAESNGSFASEDGIIIIIIIFIVTHIRRQ